MARNASSTCGSTIKGLNVHHRGQSECGEIIPALA